MSNKIKELFLQQTKEQNIVFSTGFRDLDNCIKNVKTGSLITIGGRPAMGKTELTLSIVNHLIQNNKKVAYFNLNMSEDYFINRLIANKTNLPIKNIFERQIELNSIISDLDFYENNNLEIINEYNLTIDKLEQKIGNSELVVIDYIQLVKSDNLEIDIIQELKRIAIEKNIVIIVLSQISRRVERRNNKYPLLAGLYCNKAISKISKNDNITKLFIDTNSKWLKEFSDYPNIDLSEEKISDDKDLYLTLCQHNKVHSSNIY